MKALKILTQTGLCVSQGEAKKVIKMGGCNINGSRITDFDTVIDTNRDITVQVGKRKRKEIKKDIMDFHFLAKKYGFNTGFRVRIVECMDIYGFHHLCICCSR